MGVRVEFETDNAAFEQLGDEAARILRAAADRIQKGGMTGPLRDANGNTVGQFQVLPSGDDGRADFARREAVGNQALALIGVLPCEPTYDIIEEYASDLISHILTAAYGDPRLDENLDAATQLLARARRSYEGDAEDYDWEVGT